MTYGISDAFWAVGDWFYAIVVFLLYVVILTSVIFVLCYAWEWLGPKITFEEDKPYRNKED